MEKLENSLVTSVLAYELIKGFFGRKKLRVWGYNEKQGYMLIIHDYKTGKILRESKADLLIDKIYKHAILSERGKGGRSYVLCEGQSYPDMRVVYTFQNKR